MKNRLFVFAFAGFASLMGANQSFGQAVHNSDPKPLTCTNDPLNPIAGKPYDYSATFSPDGGTAFWYATKSTTFITNSGRVAAIEAAGGSVVSAATNYNAPQASVASPSTTNITWNSDGLSTVTTAAPLFVVVEYQSPAGSCSNNMKVYNILPKNGFTVDIRSMSSDGATSAAYEAKTDQCVADVKGAVYNVATTSMNMDYGTQTLYFEVIAANFSESFTPSFKISGLDAAQTAEIFWGNTIATTSNSLGAIVNDTPVAGTAVSTAETNTSNGVSMYVKVVIQNGKFENTAGQTITLAVDAVNKQGQDDVLESDCTVNTAYADAASQDIKARPTVTPNTGTGFVPQN